MITRECGTLYIGQTGRFADHMVKAFVLSKSKVSYCFVFVVSRRPIV